jgi:trimethylamine--corrinoid protein Co-methyltransferase
MSQGLLTSVEDLQLIHETAIRILAEIGVRTDHAGMRDRLVGQGCRVQGERVFFPPELVADTVHSIPASFTLYGRSTQDFITVGLDETHATNTGIFANMYDFETGRIRRTTLEDVKTTTRLLDAMGNIHAVYVSLVDATELEPHMVTPGDFGAVLANTTKPLTGPGVTHGAEAETIVAMARAVRGGDTEELKRFPICVPFVCPVSPLYVPKDIVDALIVVAEAGLPLNALPNPVMGLTSPYTIASTVALGHAEVLALAVMAHSISPGLPILNQNSPSVADMRSLASTTGGPETGLLRQTVVRLSHYLHIPVCAHGHTSSARLDFQAAEEKALNGLLIASARPSLLGGLGALANVTLTSYETIVLDNERYGAIFRILEAIQVDEDHLALEVIAELVEAGTVLGSEHTLRHLYSGEVWQPHLATRQGLVGGSLMSETSLERARAEAKRLIDTYQVEPLPAPIQSEINYILVAYDRRHTRPHPSLGSSAYYQ